MRADPDDPLSVATGIGDLLCRTALEDDGLCTWMGTTWQGDDESDAVNVAYETLGPELYDGTSGVALFLAELYAVRPAERFADVALGGMLQALSRVDRVQRSMRCGVYSGRVGLAYAAARTGYMLDRPDLIARANDLLTDCDPADDESHSLDLIGGLAGAGPVLLLLAEWLDRPDLEASVRRIGYRLARTVHGLAGGWSLVERSVDAATSRGLTGFAHGAAGFGWSLLELYDHFGDEALLDAARESFRYENRWFHPGRGNWLDLREFEGDEAHTPCGVAWCHGAPGIAISRLRALASVDDECTRRDAGIAIDVAKRALLRARMLGDAGFSLCHGVAGLGDILLYGAHVLGDVEARIMTMDVAGEAARRYAATPESWPTGVPRGSTPALMTGLAGIGYFYLRLAKPEVPSVLRLGPGRGGGGASVPAADERARNAPR